MRAWLLAALMTVAVAGGLNLVVSWVEELDQATPVPDAAAEAELPDQPEPVDAIDDEDLGTPVVINAGWIGGPCVSDAECTFEGGFCLLPVQGYPEGLCTMRCNGSCPDRRGDLFSDTMCVANPQQPTDGICMSRCALHLTPTGCRDGYVCTTTSRHRAPATERLVCMPDLGTPAPETECTARLRDRHLDFGRPDMADAETTLGESRRTCQIDTPILLASPVHGVDYRETGRRLAEHLLVSCEMADAVDRMTQVLARLDIVEVEHVGTYNCRGIAGSSRLSAHATGRALDVKGFERATGEPVNIQRDWNGRSREKREWLRKVVKELKVSGIFRLILTPDSDARHHDHFHLEIR
ncbi:MAG: extensin family protein [Myxococcota bacterium]